MTRPRHSIVIPVSGPSDDLAVTLASLREQGDVRVELLLQPVGARPIEAPASKERLEVLVGAPEPLASRALQAGLAAARGEWLSFLEPGERLLPLALARACEGAPQGVLVSGRAAVVDGRGQAGGLELPWPYRGRFEHLAFWRHGFHALPPPATFWHRALVERLGGLGAADAAAPFYALTCRYTRAHRVLLRDELLALTPRLDAFVTSPAAVRAYLDVSRRNWGPAHAPLAWRCRFDLLRHEARLADRARRHLARVRNPWLGAGARAGSALQALLLAPATSVQSLLWEPAKDALWQLWARAAGEPPPAGRPPYADGWAGPRLQWVFNRLRRAGRVTVRGQHKHPHAASVPLQLELRIDGQTSARHTVVRPGPFELSWQLPAHTVAPLCVEVLAGPSFVPAELLGGDDRRELSFVLEALTLTR